MAPTVHSKPHLGAGAAVLVGVFASWCVLLGGLAACQHQGVALSYTCEPLQGTVETTPHFLLYVLQCTIGSSSSSSGG